MKKLFLVDVSSMFFRAFYAIPPLTNSSGLPTNALYGFLAMSIKLLRESKPDYMVFCFDRPEPSFREEIYEDYKANRSEMPDDLQPQIPYVRSLTEDLGILALDKENYEADDVIGTLAKWGSKQGLDVTIVSGDKDFAQLVNETVRLYDTMKNIVYDDKGVSEKWGVPPEQIIDYLSIVGDSSDNIPGVRGVGPKGAQKLLAEYKSLEDIYNNIDKIKPEGLQNKLIESKKSAFLAKQLVTIKSDLDLGLSLEDLKLKPIDKEKLKGSLDELEFTAFLRKIFPSAEDLALSSEAKSKANKVSVDKEKVKSKNITVSSIDATTDMKRQQVSLNEFLNLVQPYEEVWVAQNERGLCFGYGDTIYQVDAQLEEIGAALENKMLLWKGFNLKSIWWQLNLKGQHTPKWDAMLAAYILKAGDCEDFAKIYLMYTDKTLPDLCGPEEILICNLELHTILSQRLAEVDGEKVLQTLELPLIPVLYSMEKYGVLLNVGLLDIESGKLTKDLQALEKEIFRLSGESFNVNSPKQLSVILFEKLKIPSVKKTKTGFSTDNDVLSKLAPNHPICQSIIDFRELSKLKSTYVDALPALVNRQDGRIHTQFHQAITTTGRLSSTHPNLQNIPIRTERGRMVRKAFVAAEGHSLLSVDYSQIELRVLAEITQDPGLCAAFEKNLDIHAATAAEIFDVPLSDVTSEQRRMAKAVNFGIAYGQGIYGLAETLEISREEAKGIIENYFRKFPKVKDYMLDTVARAREQGFVETLFGRRRYIDEFKSSNQAVQKFGERASVNAPMQGTASDLVKMAMIKIHDNLNINMVLQVHDELLFEVPTSEVEGHAEEVREIMEGITPFRIPLRVNMAWGLNWDDAHA